MKNLTAKLIIFSLVLTSFGCNQTNEKIIVKKTIKSLNNSSITGTISFTQENDSVYLEAHVFGLSFTHS